MKYYEIELNYLKLRQVKEHIESINRDKFGGLEVLQLSDDCEFDYNFKGCYYEGDPPNIILRIPYNPPAKKAR